MAVVLCALLAQINPASAQPGRTSAAGAPCPGPAGSSHISVAPLSSGPTRIRVAVALGASDLDIELPDGAVLSNATTGSTISLPAQTRLTFLPAPSRGVRWRRSSPTHAGSRSFRQAGEEGYLLKPSGGESLFGINGKLYRGSLLIRRSTSSSGGINAINVVTLEDYLLSVVPSEMPSHWPAEALKAQALVARSYAVANAGKHEQDGYDLKSTGEDQVYNGVGAESESTNCAVAATSGLVLKYQGQVIPAFFHSTSGGFTEAAENVWGKAVPFLQSVPDYDDRSPSFTWTTKMPVASVEEALRKTGMDVGSLLAVLVVSRAPSMRAQNVLVAGSSGTHVLGGGEIRRILSLPSANFNVGCLPNTYVFAGRGCGHGLGLSQWGAKALAENGYNAAQIVTYYYRDVSVDSL